MQQVIMKVAAGSKRSEYWFSVFIKIYFVLNFGQIFSSVLGGNSLWSMTTACYGSDLECSTFIVKCNSNHIIVVGAMEYAIKETWPCVFGVSDCQRLQKTCCTFDADDKKIPFHDADVVTTHRLCSGRQQCQVEVPRIVEGASVSNYGVMHYKCMEGKKVVDMCSKGIHRGKDFYLMFDGNVIVKSSYFERGSINCTCKVISSDCSSRILHSISDIRMLQPANNFHQGCSRSTLHIANKTVTCSANSSTGTYPSIGYDEFNSVSYTSTVSLRNQFQTSRFDIPEFVLLSASAQDTISDILLTCNMDNSELQSTCASTIGESTPRNDKSSSSTTPQIAPSLQHPMWSTQTTRSLSLLYGVHKTEGPNLAINTAKYNVDKTNSKTSQDFVNTFDKFLIDTNVHKSSDKSERKTSTSRHFGVTLKQVNGTSISSEGIYTKSHPNTISWSASQGNVPPGLTTRKIPLFSPIQVTHLFGYIPTKSKTPVIDHSSRFSEKNNISDPNVNDPKTTEHQSTTPSSKDLTTETSRKDKPQGNSYVLAIIGGVVAFLLVVAVIAVFIYTRTRDKNGPIRFKRPFFYPFDGAQKKNPPISSFGEVSAGRNISSMRQDLQETGTVRSTTCSQDTECRGPYEIYEAVDFHDNRGRDNKSSNSGSSSDRLYARIKRARESITKF